MTGLVGTRRLAVTLTAAGAALLGITGCSATASTCAVRHGYAIVVFESGAGSNSRVYVTRFRLNVRYSQGNVAHYQMVQRIGVDPSHNGQPSMVIRTYRVGSAQSCSIDKVKTHW